jgi:hypothetical protein
MRKLKATPINLLQKQGKNEIDKKKNGKKEEKKEDKKDVVKGKNVKEKKEKVDKK